MGSPDKAVNSAREVPTGMARRLAGLESRSPLRNIHLQDSQFPKNEEFDNDQTQSISVESPRQRGATQVLLIAEERASQDFAPGSASVRVSAENPAGMGKR